MNNCQLGMLEIDPHDMPLADTLQKLAAERRSSWHMPAHGGGRDLPAWLAEHLAGFDVTELPLTGDINNPAGPAEQAMSLAARSFNAGLTRFITSGSTTALQTMLAVAVGRGGSLLLPRAVHQAVAHAIALLDIKPCWIEDESPLPPAYRPFSLLPQISARQVDAALHRHPECRAVILTSPDYYGFCPDLVSVAHVAHTHGKLLLVDEAHGAHLAFSPLLPISAMQAGADACVQSGHKTLPVLTPGALLHISADALSAGRLDCERLTSLVPVFQTSSPSFAIAATLDYARAWLDRIGNQAIRIQLDHLKAFRSSLPTGMTCLSGDAWQSEEFQHDPLRLVLAGPENLHALPARHFSSCLTAEGIDIEFADLSRMVLIPSLRQPEREWQRLSDTIRHLMARLDTFIVNRDLSKLENEWRYWLLARPQQILPPGDVLFGQLPFCRVRLADAAGRICARPILPYPPGIPLIWPGERIDDLRVDFLRRLSENSISINGIDQDSLLVLA